jgi:putative oxidoreductase
MFQISRWFTGLAPQLLSVLRIIVAFLFMEHGGEKLFSFPAPFMFHIPTFSLIWFAGVLEVFGGFLILIGLFTRPVAFLLSGEMAIAYFMMHAPHGFWPLLNHGEAAVFYCFVYLYMAAAGGGAWSVDRLISKGK